MLKSGKTTQNNLKQAKTNNRLNLVIPIGCFCSTQNKLNNLNGNVNGNGNVKGNENLEC